MVNKEILYKRREYMKYLAGNKIQIARKTRFSLQNGIKGGSVRVKSKFVCKFL